MKNSQKVLFVVLAIIGVLLTLHINDALATEKETTKPLKCAYAPFTPGAFEVPGKGYGEFFLAEPTVITVLETKGVPALDPNGNVVTQQMYRFSATYDKPVMFCPRHGPEPFEIYSKGLPPIALENFLLPVDAAVECK